MNKVTFESNCVENGKLTSVKEELEFNTKEELFSFLKGKPYSKELKNEINLNLTVTYKPFKKSEVTENGFNLFTYTFEKPIESTKTERDKTVSEKRKEQQENAKKEIIKKYESVNKFMYKIITEDEKEYRANFISRSGDLRGNCPFAIIKDDEHKTYYSYHAGKMEDIERVEKPLGEFEIIFYCLGAKELLKIFENIIGKKVLGVIIIDGRYWI